MTSVKRLRERLKEHLKAWEQQPLLLSWSDSGRPPGFHAQVAQYEFHDIGALEDRLSQFPSGTRFFLSTSPIESPANDAARTELRGFLSAHGMVVAGEMEGY